MRVQGLGFGVPGLGIGFPFGDCSLRCAILKSLRSQSTANWSINVATRPRNVHAEYHALPLWHGGKSALTSHRYFDALLPVLPRRPKTAIHFKFSYIGVFCLQTSDIEMSCA